MYRLWTVHCQVTRYSHRVPGHLTRYSVSAHEISFRKKNSQSDCVFQLMLGLGEQYSPSPLGDFNRLFESQIGVLFKIWHWNVIYVLNGINLVPKMSNLYHCFAGKSKLNAVSTSQSKSKQIRFPWCLIPIGTIQHLNTLSTVLTNSSVLVARAVCGEWRWQPQQNLLISVFNPLYVC